MALPSLKKITRLYKSIFIVSVGHEYGIIRLLLVELRIFAKAFLIQKEKGKDRELVEREIQMTLKYMKRCSLNPN